MTVTANVIPALPTTTTVANAFGDTLTVTTNLPSDTPHVIPVQETASGVILAFGAPSLTLPLLQQGLPVPFTVRNTGSVLATVSIAPNNDGGLSTLTSGPPRPERPRAVRPSRRPSRRRWALCRPRRRR